MGITFFINNFHITQLHIEILINSFNSEMVKAYYKFINEGYVPRI